MDIKLLSLEKVNYKPLVYSQSLFYPVKHKTDIKGFWKNEKGKVHIDNIKIKNFPAIHTDYFKSAIQYLFFKGEKSIFYKNWYNAGVLEDCTGNKIILNYRIAWIEKRLRASLIKELLKQHNGLTIYKLDKCYLIEIYK